MRLSNNLEEAAQQLRHKGLLSTSDTTARSPDGVYGMDEVLLITPKLAVHWKFPWADDADVLRAIDNCAMRVDSLLNEADQRAGTRLSDTERAQAIIDTMRLRFRRALLTVAPHKAAPEDYEL